jgi:2-polyprenyl-3-methyl-5-hydroxy-6-metoxy-1,4-benzoquinol methylase
MTNSTDERCGACGSDSVRPHTPIPEKVSSPRLFPPGKLPDGSRMLECGQCGHIWADPASCRQINYVEASGKREDHEWAFGDRRAHVKLVLAELRQFTGRRRLRILDFGCGFGVVAAEFAALGQDVVGYDPADGQVAYAREHFGIEAHSGLWAEAAERLGQVDAVYSQNVFEHLADPFTVLTELLAVVRPGGVVHLAVPNFESRQVGYDVPGHLQYFSPHSLARLAERAGLRVVACRSGRPLIERFHRLTGHLPPLSALRAIDLATQKLGVLGWTIRLYAKKLE